MDKILNPLDGDMDLLGDTPSNIVRKLNPLNGRLELVYDSNSYIQKVNPFTGDFDMVGGEAAIMRTVTGNGYVDLTNAIEDKLVYVKLFGACEQDSTPTPTTPKNITCNNGVIKTRMTSGLPLGYQRVEYIKSNKAIDLGIKTTRETVLIARFQRTVSEAQYLYCSDTSSSGTTNTTAYLSSGGNWRFGNRTVSVNVAAGVWHTSKQSKDGVEIDDEVIGTYSSIGSFTSSANLSAFGASTKPSTQIDYIKERTYNTSTFNHNWVACKRYDDVYGFYDLIGNEFYTNNEATITGGNVVDSLEIYIDGTTEIVEDELSNQATAQNLLGIGDYKDIQEVLYGHITRKVGIKVLDGTENRTTGTTAQQYYNYSLTIDDALGQSDWSSRGGFITHFDYYIGNDAPTYQAAGENVARFNSSKILRLQTNSTLDTLSNFKDWLKGQYNAGTPVIVVYPLATPTTETATGQTLNIVEGNNTIEIVSSSIDALPLEVKYKATA